MITLVAVLKQTLFGPDKHEGPVAKGREDPRHHKHPFSASNYDLRQVHLGRRREADGVLGAWGQTSQVGLWVVEGHFGKLCHKYLGFCEAGSFLRVDKTCVGGKRRLCTSLKSRTAIENLTTLITGCER